MTLLQEVDLIIDCLPKRVRGRPRQQLRLVTNQRRDALCKAVVIMLSAALEAYCEELCKNCKGYLKNHLVWLDKEDYNFIDRSIQNSHGANNDHITKLFSLVGISWITYKNVGWQNKTPEEVRKQLRLLAATRNKIAHGASVTVSEPKVRSQRDFVFRLAKRLESITGRHLASRTKTSAPWK
jgi:hypothetical protein